MEEPNLQDDNGSLEHMYVSDEDEEKNISTMNQLADYRFVKRVPQRPHTKKNEIYVSRGSNFSALYKRAIKLLEDQGEEQIIVHGLGAAVNRACKLAVALKEQSPALELSPSTSTVMLVDEYQPLKPGLDPISQVRYNSAIHIHIKQKKRGT